MSGHVFFFCHIRSGHKTNCCGLVLLSGDKTSDLQEEHKMECHKSHLKRESLLFACLSVVYC